MNFTSFQRRTVQGVLTGALALLATGCSERIQHGLDERSANELQTVLGERGVSAHKESEGGKKALWALEVDADDANDAVRILAELGLPRAEAEATCDAGGAGSLVRTPAEESACRVRELERGLERTLQGLDGVLVARVHLVMPAAVRYGQVAPPSKASALLRVQPGKAAPLRAQADGLKALLAGGVEGLSADSVSLLVDEVASKPAAGNSKSGPVARLRMLLALMGIFVTGLSVAVVLLALRLRAVRAAALEPVTVAPVVAKPVVNVPAAGRKAA